MAIRTRNDNISYAEILKKARQEISLGEIVIKVTRIRRGVNGNIMIEISGQESSEKANTLAIKLKEKLGEEEIVISRPVAMAEIRITGLDISVIKEEVIDTIMEQGDCLRGQKLGEKEIRTGDIKELYNDIGMIWARCSLRATSTLANLGKIRIGWTMAKVEMFARSPLQCFRC